MQQVLYQVVERHPNAVFAMRSSAVAGWGRGSGRPFSLALESGYIYIPCLKPAAL